MEVYKGGKECTHLGLRPPDEIQDELIEGTPVRVVENVGLDGWRRGRLLLFEGTLDRSNRRRRKGRGLGNIIRDANNVLGGLDEHEDDIGADVAANELDEGGVVLRDVDEGIWVSTGVGCAEIRLQLLRGEAVGLQDAGVIHRTGRLLHRHGRLRLRRQWGAVLHGQERVSAAFRYATRRAQAQGRRERERRHTGMDIRRMRKPL